MSEKLFRGKRIDNGKWVEGYYLCLHHDEDLHIIVDEHGEYHRCDPYTIGQYTGLTDKNGKKIFEGDIVKPTYTDKDYYGVVSYGTFNCSCCDGVYGWCFGTEDIREYDSYVVIGNIHDNPELLNSLQAADM